MKHILTFPVILLEELLRVAGLFTKILSDFLKSGTYVPTKCPYFFNVLLLGLDKRKDRIYNKLVLVNNKRKEP